MEYVLETNNLCKRYGGFPALNNVNIHIPRGEIYGLVGQNGAGKTTLIRIISGMQFPTSGSFTLFGQSSGTAGINKARKRIGGIVETPALAQSLTAEQNLKAQSVLRGNTSADEIKNLLEYVGLASAGKRRVRDMSLGMRQRLAIAMALIGNPDFLILDEPTNGLDPRGIVEIRELILKLNREKRVTVLISSHILSELEKLATYYGIIDKGMVARELSARELSDRCRKKQSLTVNDTGKLAVAFDRHGLQYKILSRDRLELYSDVPVETLFGIVKSAGVTLSDIRAEEEDLESYYMNLIGGKR
ncbi:ABC transporter ATP-binding protein [Anaerocaecibacter muris]|uniref:ABC transporter ATP-binding protein n=1 Tax=Anaerocaecibacter muris TaxID=2941513 RepID=UPI003F692C1F